MVAAVLKSKVIHTDDTPVRLLGEAGAQTGRLWVYRGDHDHAYTVYDATARRKRDGPMTFLCGFTGYLQADAFSGYDGVYARGVTEVASWAHARRKFVGYTSRKRGRSQNDHWVHAHGVPLKAPPLR